MRQTVRLWLVAAVCLGVGSAGHILAQGAPTSPTADTTTAIVSAAEAVLATLDAAGRERALFAFDDIEQRARWSNLPTGIVERRGLRMGDLSPAQRSAVDGLLRAALSEPGYRKVMDIVQGDEVLRAGGNGGGRGGGGRGGRGGGLTFGEDEYYLAFLGPPSATTPWMLQFGGHHLAINLTIVGSAASMAPSLPAAQPAVYSIEGREIRPLGRETDLAFRLINALDETRRGQAILPYRVSDLVLGPGEDGRVIQPEGLRASSMTPAQQTMLLDMTREWVGIMADAFADVRMDEIRSNLADTFFAWSGPTTEGSVSYFRIQGPTVVIEYAPQNSVDHIHTIYRDPTNDYGAKLVAR